MKGLASICLDRTSLEFLDIIYKLSLLILMNYPKFFELNSYCIINYLNDFKIKPLFFNIKFFSCHLSYYFKGQLNLKKINGKCPEVLLHL